MIYSHVNAAKGNVGGNPHGKCNYCKIFNRLAHSSDATGTVILAGLPRTFVALNRKPSR